MQDFAQRKLVHEGLGVQEHVGRYRRPQHAPVGRPPQLRPGEARRVRVGHLDLVDLGVVQVVRLEAQLARREPDAGMG